MPRDREEPGGNYLLARGISPGTFQRLHIVKAQARCKTWAEYLGVTLEMLEANLEG